MFTVAETLIAALILAGVFTLFILAFAVPLINNHYKAEAVRLRKIVDDQNTVVQDTVARCLSLQAQLVQAQRSGHAVLYDDNNVYKETKHFADVFDLIRCVQLNPGVNIGLRVSKPTGEMALVHIANRS